MSIKLTARFIKTFESSLIVFVLIFAEVLEIPSQINGLINALSYLISAYILFTHAGKILYFIKANILLLLLLSIAFFSFFWSQAAEVTSEQLRALFRTTLFGVYIASNYSTEEQLQLFAWPYRITAIVSLLAVILMPSYATHMPNKTVDWKGIYAHKQYLGRSMALASSLHLVLMIRNIGKRWINFTFLLLSLAMVLFSHSKTSLVMVALTFLTYPLYIIAKQRSYRFRALLIILVLFVISIIAVVISINIETVLVDVLHKDTELNGRTPLWTLVIQKGLEHPFFGYGYAGFWSTSSGRFIAENTWGKYLLVFYDKAGLPFRWHAHNGFLEVFLQLGLVGLFLFLSDFFLTVLRITNLVITTHSLEFFWMLQFLSLTLFVNFSEMATVLSPSNIFWIIYLSVSISSVVYCKEVFRKPRTGILVE